MEAANHLPSEATDYPGIISKRFVIVATSIILLAALLGGTLGSSNVFRRVTSKGGAVPYRAPDDIEKDYNEAVAAISSNYAGDIDYDKATQAAIQGMLSTLDPHSVYFPYGEFKKLKEDQDSQFVGIGVTILKHRDGVYVQSTVEGTPASRLGLRYGDRILEVDGKDARSWSSEQVSKNVRGERGDPVTIKVERPGAEAPMNFTIIRDAVPLPSIRNAFIIRTGIGYIGLIGGFQHNTDQELRAALKKLKDQGMRQLILDLRGNPGGLLEQAIEVASEFLPSGRPIVSVKGRSEYSEPLVYKSTGTDPEDLPMVVLINGSTASASEIVAGAIQDHGRGLIVGQTSFGKGLVQRVFQLPFSTGLTLTTARFYTPYGRSLQRDYSSGSIYDYYTRHEKPSPTPDTSDTEGPAALASPATSTQSGPVKTAAGRVFYGGGGITPDIEVKPLEPTQLRWRISEEAFYFTRKLATGLVVGLESYRVDKVQHGRSAKPGDYPITDRLVEAFKEFVRNDAQSELTAAQIDQASEFVKLRLREEIITAAFSNDAGGRVLLDSDPQVLKAIEALPGAKRLAESVREGVWQS